MVGISFGTFAQSKDELKLKSFYKEGNFDKCDQLCAKLEKKSTGDALATVHLYGALANLGLLLDEQYDVYDNKKPIRTVAVEIGKYLKIVSDSVRNTNKLLEAKVLKSLETVIVNQLEIEKYNDAKYLASKLYDGDTLNIGAANTLDFIAMVEGTGKIANRVNSLLNNNYEMTAKYESFFVETTVIYAAWLVKEGKSDAASEMAQAAINLVGDNDMLEVFR